MMIRRDWPAAARILTIVAAAVTVGGCATKRDVRDLHDAIEDLALRQDSLIRELRSETRLTQDTLRGQSNQIVDFRGEISHQLEMISQSLTRLEALTGENQRSIASIRDQLVNMRRLPGSSAGGDATDSTAATGGGANVPPAREISAEATPGGAEAMYNAALGQYHEGMLSTAQTAFQGFLDTYPNHKLAPDAHFYLGDILEQQGDTTRAVAQFRLIPSNFPTADKAPDAMYRIALVDVAHKRTKTAKAALQRIVNTYPGTDAAKLAQAELDKLGG